LLSQEKPTHLAVAFDISRYSFRTREYAEYKGTRGETPPEFIGQVPLLEEALAAMNIVTISKEDYEADDILATLAATRGAADGYRVLVVSGDRDAIQLVNDDVTLLYPNARGVSELKRYDRDAVMERYGIEPEQYPDVAALVGETSDNLIGIDKVGEKTAVKWIKQYGSLDEILAHADEIKGVVGREAAGAARERGPQPPLEPAHHRRRPACRSRGPRASRHQHGPPSRRSSTGCSSAHCWSVSSRSRPPRVRRTSSRTPSAVVDDDSSAQLAPVVRTLVDEELAQWLTRHSADGTTALGLRIEVGGEGITGFGIASSTDSVYVPWAADRPDYAALEAWLAGPSPKYLLDAKRQLKALTLAGIELGGIAFDTSLASWLLRRGRSRRISPRRSTPFSARP
jgi:DNA polymerase-1